jgi:O-antigen ligase
MLWTDVELTSEEYYDQIRYFLMLALFIMATMLISSKSEKLFNQIKFWLSFVGMLAAVFFVIVFYSSHSFAQTRLGGPFDYTHNPNQAAMHFGFVTIIAFYSFFFSKIQWHKIFYLSVSLITFGFVFLCESRGPMLAIICTIVLGLIFEKHWKTISILLLTFASLIIVYEIFNIGSESLIERGFTNRIDLWLNALKRISQAPFWGEGYFTNVYMEINDEILSPHNLLLLIMVKSGITGGGIFLILSLTAFLHSFKIFRTSGNWLYFSLFVYFTVCMTFDSVHILYKPSLAWLIFWLPVGLLAGNEIRQKKLTPGTI